MKIEVEAGPMIIEANHIPQEGKIGLTKILQIAYKESLTISPMNQENSKML